MRKDAEEGRYFRSQAIRGAGVMAITLSAADVRAAIPVRAFKGMNDMPIPPLVIRADERRRTKRSDSRDPNGSLAMGPRRSRC
jgi:hypothetical protein